MGGADWILFILLSLLWLASGGIPLSVLRRRQPGSPNTALPPREEPDHSLLRNRWLRGRKK
jgi:hypothetical protein